MAKKFQLQDRSGKDVYPVTTVDCVIDGDKSLHDTLESIPVVEEYVGDVQEIVGVTREDLKKDLFIDLWNQQCGSAGRYDPDGAPDPEHPFFLNKLWIS